MDYYAYMTLLSKTAFVLCPAGNNPETFRLYESLETGSIPLFVRPSIEIDYLQYKYWYNYPGPIFNSWDELKPFLNNVTSNYIDDLQLKINIWYKEFKENIQHNITETMLMAFNEAPQCSFQDSESVNDISKTTGYSTILSILSLILTIIIDDKKSNYIDVLEQKLDSVDKQYQIIMKELKYYVNKAGKRIKSLYDINPK